MASAIKTASSNPDATRGGDHAASGSSSDSYFKPALIVVDMQEDFCPPNGSLAVAGGRLLAPLINSLLSLPGFVVKVATQDFHHSTHISFASNHDPPNNRPFESFIDMNNPAPGKHGQTKPQRLWPVHCVQNTPGDQIIPEIGVDKLDLVVKKGMDERVEMYSAFADAFGNTDCVASGGVNIDLTNVLREKGVTDVYVVGLAGDYCVKSTAVDAAKQGFKTWVVAEGTKCVDPEKGWDDAKKELESFQVTVISIDGQEIERVRAQAEKTVA